MPANEAKAYKQGSVWVVKNTSGSLGDMQQAPNGPIQWKSHGDYSIRLTFQFDVVVFKENNQNPLVWTIPPGAKPFLLTIVDGLPDGDYCYDMAIEVEGSWKPVWAVYVDEEECTAGDTFGLYGAMPLLQEGSDDPPVTGRRPRIRVRGNPIGTIV